jgi:NADH-quinone oxidoreductase subunit M
MIGVWGRGQNKEFAAYKITLYLSIGALLTLAGLIFLYLHYKTFSLVEVLHAADTGNVLTNDSQSLVFALMMFGLGILVSLWPFHTWAPLGYAAAPTATAMMHAGVIKKFGLFMLIKVALPILPVGAQIWLPILALLSLGNILYCGLVAMRQKDLNLLIGNSSVAHMGFVFLGIASATLIGLTGAVMVMVAHGLLAALAFGLSGYLHQQTRTLDMEKIQGLLAGMPFWGTLMIMALMAGCGLPGFANFSGELTVFFGAWKVYPVITGIAVWSALVIGAVYMLRAIRTLLHGLKGEDTPETEDIPACQRLPYAILVTVLLLFGFYPRLITEKINQSEPTFKQATAAQSKETK